MVIQTTADKTFTDYLRLVIGLCEDLLH